MSHRLLVVEDEPSIRGPLVDVLKVKGYDVDAAERGRCAPRWRCRAPTT